jgi:signal transduction histidine kinase
VAGDISDVARPEAELPGSAAPSPSHPRATAGAAPRGYGWTTAVSVIVPAVGALAAARLLPTTKWLNEPLHSTIECAGGTIALLVASLLVARRRTLASEPQYAIFAVALTCMGLLDVAHACVPQGPAFFWSRGLPTLLGGVTMSLVWTRPRAHTERIASLGVGLAAAITLVVCVALVAFPDAWPLMFSPAGYTVGAKLLNVVGGIGFLAGAGLFVQRHRADGAQEHVVVANHLVLFGMAGLLFSVSHMWGAVWWLFHALRLVAYLVVLGYAFALFRRFQHEQGALEARLEFQQLMLGTVGHDMRSPIGAIKMTLDVLEQRAGPLRAADASALDRIRRSAARLEELVNGVLDFARARSGAGIPVDPTHVALEDVVRRAIDEVAAANGGHRIECRVSGRTAGWWDPARLTQLTTNLLQNAVRHGARSGPVDVIVDGTKDREVLLCVHNLGEPIPASHLPRIFEPFERRRSPGENAAGLGLGLFIVREIARAHGGHVSVTSSADAGTAFTVTLPRGDEVIVPPAPRASSGTG